MALLNYNKRLEKKLEILYETTEEEHSHIKNGTQKEHMETFE